MDEAHQRRTPRDELSPEAVDEMVVDQVAFSLRIDGYDADPDQLRNILAHGTRRSMTQQQVLESVARQVASSLRFDGIEPDEAAIRSHLSL